MSDGDNSEATMVQANILSLNQTKMMPAIVNKTKRRKKRLSHVLDELSMQVQQQEILHNNNNTKENCYVAKEMPSSALPSEPETSATENARTMSQSSSDVADEPQLGAEMLNQDSSSIDECPPSSPSVIIPQMHSLSLQSMMFPKFNEGLPVPRAVSETVVAPRTETVPREPQPGTAFPEMERRMPSTLQASMSSQEAPLDLSVRGNLQQGFNPFQMPPLPPLFPLGLLHSHGNFPVPIVKGDVASPTTKESVASRYNLEVSPVVEEMPPGSDVAYVCPLCGQMFSLQDRLAKHMASRHKSKNGGEPSTKSYVCDICNRRFARSDMLTRHMRLHTGVKPYNCRTCGQVFSRSDHLSTHRRTHTGEKPYKCPQCPYAACRRDMITRHMRTHVVRSKRT